MWKVIINPTAGSGLAAKKWKTIEKKLNEAKIDFDIVFTERKGHAIELASSAIYAGFRKLIVIGGDGTNHEVMNGIMNQTIVASNEIIQCLIPVGTGNDWIRTHKLPKDIDEIIKNIKTNKTKLQDIGKASFMSENRNRERYFMNVAGLAYDAFIAKKSNENPNFTKNKIYYFYLVLRCLFDYKPNKIKVRYDDELLVDKYYTVNVGICKYNGGGMRLVPQAIPNDGLFALTTVKSMSVIGVILSTPFLYNGKIGKHPKGFTTSASEISIESADKTEILLELDGEYVGTSPIRFEILRNAFRFIG